MSTHTKRNRPTDLDRAQAAERLREHLKPGDTVYTLLKHRSQSGMFRVIDLLTIRENKPHYIGYNAAIAMGAKYDDNRDGIKAEGCGMDMGFHLVYNLSYALWPDSFDCIGEGCPSNDHFNGDRDYTPHRHSSGGYALKHRWI